MVEGGGAYQCTLPHMANSQAEGRSLMEDEGIRLFNFFNSTGENASAFLLVPCWTSYSVNGVFEKSFWANLTR